MQRFYKTLKDNTEDPMVVVQFNNNITYFQDITSFVEYINDNYNNNITPSAIVNAAFTWCETPEGDDYWSNMYDRLLSSPKIRLPLVPTTASIIKRPIRRA